MNAINNKIKEVVTNEYAIPNPGLTKSNAIGGIINPITINEKRSRVLAIGGLDYKSICL